MCTYWAEVRQVEVLPRKEIPTPWDASRNPDELQFVYHLEELVELKNSIENLDEEGESKSFRSHRWTSRLALQRAKNLKELFLETEPEWRLYENLKVAGIKFDIKPGTPKEQDPDDPSGRAKFVINNYAIQYRGAAGYLLKMSFGEDRYFSQVKDVVEGVKKRLG